MDEATRKRKISFGINWVKSPSTGNTYLCPVGFESAGATEGELRRICVEESSNPQND